MRTKSKKTGVPREIKNGKDIYSNPKDIANAFAQNFQSVYEKPVNKNGTSTPDFSGTSFNFSVVTNNDVLNSIKKLKPKKSTGPDNIPAYIYKGIAEFIASPLQHIFNLAIKNKYFPDALKTAQITPVFKSGNKNGVKNYRPISLTNVIAKIFETILCDDLYEFLKPKISKFQHGFMKDKSTTTNLSIMSEAAAEAILCRSQLDVIYTDCEKAFDKVNHKLLLDRLVELGVTENVYCFFRSYLADRVQWVSIGNCKSEPFIATSGVPQGSNLGPLLFTCFINTLPDCLSGSTGLLFADDFKLYRVVQTRADCDMLQIDIDNVTRWFSDNKMYLNIKKCTVVTFTRKTNPIRNDYKICNDTLQRENVKKDLGVLFQSNLKFNNHFLHIAEKSIKALGFLIRNTKSFRISTIIRLYNALVRPNLEYASQIWMPMEAAHIDRIERVQKRFLRYLYVLRHNMYPYKISYRSMLDEFRFESLLQRRKKQAVIYLYYILNNVKYKDCNLINYIRFNVPKTNLRYPNKQKLFSINPSSISPFNKMMAVVNEILSEVQTDIFNINLKALKAVL